MFNYGTITKNEKGNDYPFKGELNSPVLSGKFGLKTNEKRQDSSPDYGIFMQMPNGTIVPAGSVWMKTVKNGEFAGSEFMSMNFQVMGMSEPVNLVAYPEKDDPDTFSIQWKARRTAVAKTTTSAGCAQNDPF